MSPAGARTLGSAIVLLAVLLQGTIVQRIEVGNAAPDVVVLVVVALALRSESVSGAAYGFIAGVAVALLATQAVGPHAIVLVLVGYAAGRVGEAIVAEEHPLPPLVAGVVATLVVTVGRPVVDFLVNPAVTTTSGIFETAFVTTALNAVLAVPTYLAVGWAMRRLAGAAAVAGATADPEVRR